VGNKLSDFVGMTTGNDHVGTN